MVLKSLKLNYNHIKNNLAIEGYNINDKNLSYHYIFCANNFRFKNILELGTGDGEFTFFLSKRFKKANIVTIDNALDTVTKLRGVQFNKIGEDKKSVGVIAQEVLKVLPEVVAHDRKDMYSVAYGNMVGVLIEAIKELNAEVKELKEKLNN